MIIWHGAANDNTRLLVFDYINNNYSWKTTSINTALTIETPLLKAHSVPGSVTSDSNYIITYEDCDVYTINANSNQLTYKGKANANENIKVLSGLPNYVYAGGLYIIIIK